MAYKVLSSENIKNCPLCGGTAKIYGEDLKETWVISCDKCPCEMSGNRNDKPSDFTPDEKLLIINAWNGTKKTCEFCKYRINGKCENEDKIHECHCHSELDDDSDELVYDYHECGGFNVGKRFGCIHWKSKKEQGK